MKFEPSDKIVDRLAERLRENELSSEDQDQLREIIRNHPLARRRFVEHLYLTAELRTRLKRGLVEITSGNSPSSFGRLVGRVFVPLAAAAAVAFLAGRFLQPGDTTARDSRVALGKERASGADGVAVISRIKNVQWGSGTTFPVERLETGLPVGPGIIDLEKGLVQIDFYSGATVIVEAPARLKLESPMLSRLEYGNLWAEVPIPAIGFKVETRKFNVVDLGTEFGLRIRPDGEGEVHVLNGEVKVISDSGAGNAGEPQHLFKGEGVRWSAGGAKESIKARPEDFHTSKDLANAAREKLAAWKKYEYTIEKDPDALVVYSFDSGSSWDRKLANMAVAAPPKSDGAIVGCEWTEGRWPGKGALKFTNSSHRVRLNLTGTYDAMTLACWVRVDAVQSPSIALLHPETNQKNFVHWTLSKVEEKAASEQQLHLHFSASTVDDNNVESRHHYHADHKVLGTTGANLGDWMQFAVVYDPVAMTVSHYQNGALVGSSPITEKDKLGVGIADIGNWPYHEWATGTPFEVRNLVGAIDGFVILKRAWTPDEVTGYWEAGRL